MDERVSRTAEAMSGPLFDFATKKIQSATLFEQICIMAIKFGAQLSAIWGYRGFGACCRIIQLFVRDRNLTLLLSKDAAFCIPFADGYWSMLIGDAETYELDIDCVLRSLRGEAYTFLDCGANYGYWSVLASSCEFGPGRVIAVEPSSTTFSILKNNAVLNGDRFSCVRAAIGATAGSAYLSGQKHEARCVGTEAREESETVDMMALDNFIDNGSIAPNEKIIIKLDVEGLEIPALMGGARILGSDSLMICEDHGSDRQHTVSRYILESTFLNLYYYDTESHKFKKISQIEALDRVKHFRNRGYNVFATSSAFWEAKLKSHGQD